MAASLESLPHIQADLNYLIPTGAKPVSYAYAPPSGAPWSTVESETHPSEIYNLRPVASEFSLDSAGFQLARHRSAVENFWDEDEILRVYYPEFDCAPEADHRRGGSADLRPHAQASRRRGR